MDAERRPTTKLGLSIFPFSIQKPPPHV